MTQTVLLVIGWALVFAVLVAVLGAAFLLAVYAVKLRLGQRRRAR